MTPELKSFLTDLLAVLEKHDADIMAHYDGQVGVYINRNLATEFWGASPDEIKQALQKP